MRIGVWKGIWIGIFEIIIGIMRWISARIPGNFAHFLAIFPAWGHFQHLIFHAGHSVLGWEIILPKLSWIPWSVGNIRWLAWSCTVNPWQSHQDKSDFPVDNPMPWIHVGLSRRGNVPGKHLLDGLRIPGWIWGADTASCGVSMAWFSIQIPSWNGKQSWKSCFEGKTGF